MIHRAERILRTDCSLMSPSILIEGKKFDRRIDTDNNQLVTAPWSLRSKAGLVLAILLCGMTREHFQIDVLLAVKLSTLEILATTSGVVPKSGIFHTNHLTSRRTGWVFLDGRAAVDERLACSTPTKATRAQSPAGPLPDFRKWELYRTIPLVGEFSWVGLQWSSCSPLTEANRVRKVGGGGEEEGKGRRGKDGCVGGIKDRSRKVEELNSASTTHKRETQKLSQFKLPTKTLKTPGVDYLVSTALVIVILHLQHVHDRANSCSVRHWNVRLHGSSSDVTQFWRTSHDRNLYSQGLPFIIKIDHRSYREFYRLLPIRPANNAKE
ncbi:hypothetical protein PR048_025825 [Dryococelus australis]|uniref:Uncharacterized protein n=1 Tax=Dryococelus australis TaxID=614101 RepID=A0ABQ9GJL7_9NEOP|nr:hypothetical protein PR048_025825 [Dryococelus australis]